MAKRKRKAMSWLKQYFLCLVLVLALLPRIQSETLDCTNPGDCGVNDDPNDITCNSAPCTVNCVVDKSCKFDNIFCAADGECNIDCSGGGTSCKETTIYAQTATDLQLTCSDKCDVTTVYCPTSVGSSCTITCGSADNKCVNTVVRYTPDTSYTCNGNIQKGCDDITQVEYSLAPTTNEPSSPPTAEPSTSPSVNPSTEPSRNPSTGPSRNPSPAPSTAPTIRTDEPTKETDEPSQVTDEPSKGPTPDPSIGPSRATDSPTDSPSEATDEASNDDFSITKYVNSRLLLYILGGVSFICCICICFFHHKYRKLDRMDEQNKRILKDASSSGSGTATNARLVGEMPRPGFLQTSANSMPEMMQISTISTNMVVNNLDQINTQMSVLLDDIDTKLQKIDVQNDEMKQHVDEFDIATGGDLAESSASASSSLSSDTSSDTELRVADGDFDETQPAQTTGGGGGGGTARGKPETEGRDVPSTIRGPQELDLEEDEFVVSGDD